MPLPGMSKPSPLSTSKTSLNGDPEFAQSRPLFRQSYGFRFYGGSGVKRNNVREVAEKPFFFEQPLGPLASKASFNPRASILPDIGASKAKSQEELRAHSDTVVKNKSSRRAFSRKLSDKKNKNKSPTLSEAKTYLEQQIPPLVEVESPKKKKSLNPFAATFFLKRFIRQKRNTLDAEKEPVVVVLDDLDNDKEGDVEDGEEEEIEEVKEEEVKQEGEVILPEVILQPPVFVRVTCEGDNETVQDNNAEKLVKWQNLLRRTASVNALALKPKPDVTSASTSPKYPFMFNYFSLQSNFECLTIQSLISKAVVKEFERL